MRKKLTSITGKSPSLSNNKNKIKPKKSRQLINRFHVLLKAKVFLFTKLRLNLNVALTEDNYTSFLEKNCPKIFKSYQVKKSEKLQTLSANRKQNKNKIKMRTDFFHEITKYPNVTLASDAADDVDISRVVDTLAEIDAEIQLQGGLEVYQTASLSGQNDKRGSDSSKKLIQWLDELKSDNVTDQLEGLTALEIGSLSSKNKISTSNWFKRNITRIDLNSQEPELIEQQDFMKRPFPQSDKYKFDLISLSLVLNFVPSAIERGQMLQRLSSFFKDSKNNVFPCLFFVLPLPCVTNSKYINKDNLLSLLNSLGYNLLKYHQSTKLVYMLLKYDKEKKKPNIKFQKKQLANLTKKAQRNNFSIIIS